MKGIDAKNGPASMGTDVYRACGPFIEFRVSFDDAHGDLYFLPSDTFRFAMRLIWLCGYAALFRLRLILRDWGWRF